jgi:hypothetical protein
VNVLLVGIDPPRALQKNAVGELVLLAYCASGNPCRRFAKKVMQTVQRQ